MEAVIRRFPASLFTVVAASALCRSPNAHALSASAIFNEQRVVVSVNPRLQLKGTAIRSIALDPFGTSTIFVGTSETAPEILRSRDGGSTWAAIGPPIGDVRGGFDVTADPWAPGTLYAALTYTFGNRFPMLAGTVYRSRDGGDSWNEIPAGATSGVVPDSIRAGRLYAIAVRYDPLTLGESEIPIESVDFGDTWKDLPFPVDPVTALAADPAGDDVVLGGGLAGLFRSSDGGTSWATSDLTNHSVRAIAWSRDGAAVFAGTDDGIFRSEDGGNSWTSTGFSQSVNGLAVDPVDAGILFATAYGAGVFRSEDGGGTWAPMLVVSSQTITTSSAPEASDTRLYVATDVGALRFDLRQTRVLSPR